MNVQQIISEYILFRNSPNDFWVFLQDCNILEPGMTVGRLSVLWALQYLLPWSQHVLAKKLRNSAEQMEGDVSSLGILVLKLFLVLILRRKSKNNLKLKAS